MAVQRGRRPLFWHEPELQVHDRDALQLVQLFEVGQRRPLFWYDALFSTSTGSAETSITGAKTSSNNSRRTPMLSRRSWRYYHRRRPLCLSSGFSTSTSPPALARTCSAIGARKLWRTARLRAARPAGCRRVVDGQRLTYSSATTSSASLMNVAAGRADGFGAHRWLI